MPRAIAIPIPVLRRLLTRSLPIVVFSGALLPAGAQTVPAPSFPGQEPPPSPLSPASAIAPPPVFTDPTVQDPLAPVRGEEIRRAGPAAPTDGPDPGGLLLPETPSLPGAGPLPPPTEVRPARPTGAVRPTVSMGADLQPERTVTPIRPDEMISGAARGPRVDSADPWIFGLEAQAVYDDNVFLSGGDRKSDTIFVFTPSLKFQHGDVLLRQDNWAKVRYAVSGIVFAKLESENSIDHDFEAGAQKRFGNLAVSGEGRFRRLSGATPDLGDRAQRNEITAHLGAGYTFSGKTFLEAGLRYNGARYQSGALADYDEWLAESFVGYQITGRSRASAGVAAGQTRVSGFDAQNFQRALVKAETEITGTLKVKGTGGVEFRQAARGDEVKPVFNVSAAYDADGRTKVGVEGFRETLASGSLGGENLTRTGAGLRIEQEIGSRFTAAMAAGYEQLVYENVARTETLTSGRSDDYLYFRPSLRYEFTEGKRAEIYYNYREDDSSLADFSFDGAQLGVSVGVEF